MVSFFNKHKLQFRILEAIILMAFVIVLLSASSKVSEKNVCKFIQVNLANSESIKFINEQEIKNLIERNVDHFIIGKRSQLLDIERIEAEVKKISFVNRVDAFINSNNSLCINVQQRKPLVRVINKNNVSYYIDENKNKFPTSDNFTARVTIVHGNVEDNGRYEGIIKTKDLNQIYEFATYINKNEFWKAMVEQIYIDKKKEYSFIPKWGNTEIKLGTLKGYKTKLKKLKIYYKQNIANNNWSKCEAINLKYKNQVVCETAK